MFRNDFKHSSIELLVPESLQKGYFGLLLAFLNKFLGFFMVRDMNKDNLLKTFFKTFWTD